MKHIFLIISLSFTMGCNRTKESVSVEGPYTSYSENYRVKIVHSCPEGCVSCDDIRIALYDRRNRNVSEFIGSTLHTYGPDGITPSRFLGYSFRNKDRTYYVMDGVLTIKKDNHVIIEEELKWKTEE